MAWSRFRNFLQNLKYLLTRPRRKNPKLLRYSTSGTYWDGVGPVPAHAPEQPTGQEWAFICEQMLASDPKLSSAAMQLTDNLLDASWTIKEGASENWEAQRNAEFIRECFGLDGKPCHLASGSFEHEMRSLVRYPLTGFHVSEIIYRCDNDGIFWIDSIADIATPSIWRWIRNSNGYLSEIVQLCPSVGIREPMPIPASKTLIITRNKTGDDYLGVGLLSPCYNWFCTKQSLIRALDLGVQRIANPILMLRPDRQALQDEGYSLDEQQNMLETAKGFGEAWSQGAASVLVAPMGIDPSVFTSGAFDTKGIINAIRHVNEEIMAAFLSNFSELGVTESGNRSVGEIHWNSYRSSIANYLDEIADSFNGPSRPGGGLIARLLEINFYPNAKCPADCLPRIAHRGVEVNGIREMSNILPQMVASGLLTPTNTLEQAILRELKIEQEVTDRTWQDRLQEVGSVQEAGKEGGRPPLEDIQ